MILTVQLDRVFLEIGPLTIYWYGVIIATGVGLGLWLAVKEADRLGIKKDLLLDFLLYAIPIAILSARIYYVIFEWNHFAGEPFWKVFAIWEGGIAIHGAIIGGVLTAIVYSEVRKISFWQLADIVAPSLILGQAIGRWGNFMNQEAYGGPLLNESFLYELLPDFIINQMTIDGITYHPTFLYESLWNILILITLLILRRNNPIRGEVFLTYAIGYSIGRFFIEGMRMDSLYVFADFRTAQLVSIIGIIVAVILIIYRRKTITTRYDNIVKHSRDQKVRKGKTSKKKTNAKKRKNKNRKRK